MLRVLQQKIRTKKTHIGKKEAHERRMGSFNINEEEFTLILKVIKSQGASNSLDETVESFSIVDKEGKIHYHKSFDDVQDFLPLGVHDDHSLGLGAADHTGEATHAVNRNLIEMHLSLLCFHLSGGRPLAAKRNVRRYTP
jgi:hypothetical protein